MHYDYTMYCLHCMYRVCSLTFPVLLHSGAQGCVHKEADVHFWTGLFRRGVVHCWLHCRSSEGYLRMHHP